VLDSEEAVALRALLAEHGQDGLSGETGPMRGLTRLLRRNPTDAERALWRALTNDRRFAGQGVKRQVPVGPHIADFVSFPLRLVIELIPARETDAAAKSRAKRRAWLSERGYRVLEVEADAVEANLQQVLEQLAREINGSLSTSAPK
jgi:tRNA/rRNA methyltransferase